MRALVISGGASKGAFAGGVSEYLICELGRHYDIFCGTSTGSLLVPLLAAGEVERAKQVYCNVRQTDIFSNCPFVIKKTSKGFRTGFNHAGILWQFIKGKKTLGESKSLRQLIRRTITPEVFATLHARSAEVIITVANLTNNVIEYKYARDYDYDEFCEWIWISANMVPFMTLVTKNGCEYGDGGFGNLIPIQEAINIGATELDVVILNPRHLTQKMPPSTSAFHLLMKGFHFMLHQIGQDDINMALLESRYTGIKIHLIHTPKLLTDNSFVFDPDQMKGWWQEGYDYARFLFSDSKEE
ncbi:MAG TPA: patatin-like phospholipase family protein [Saprospiraceae bacterium]|nr:patatin-like phospholipase family protein [Saprospiraceae bacterium]